MRRVMFLLSLIAALAGTPLRIAEAARDLGVMLAGLDDEGEYESPDGGVGDDSGVTIKGESLDTPGEPGLAAFAATSPGLGLRPPCRSPRPPADRSARGSPVLSRRLALLQRYLC